MKTATVLKPAMLFAAGTIATAAHAEQQVTNPTIVNNNGLGYAALPAPTFITLVGNQPQYNYQQNFALEGIPFGVKTYDFTGFGSAQVTSDFRGSAFYPDADNTSLGQTAQFGVKDPIASFSALAAGDKFYGLRFNANSQDYVGYVNVNQAGDFINEIGFELAQTPTAAVPEPETWALMILGFGGAGLAMRRRRRQKSVAAIA